MERANRAQVNVATERVRVRWVRDVRSHARTLFAVSVCARAPAPPNTNTNTKYTPRASLCRGGGTAGGAGIELYCANWGMKS
jgi:hypothetical protein